MKKIIQDLFYSTQEGILFWVAGYTGDNNTDDVHKMIDILKQNAILFAEQAGVHFDEVKTFYNTIPPRYQYMRIFYTYVPKNIKGAFRLRKDWTMSKWITS